MPYGFRFTVKSSVGSRSRSWRRGVLLSRKSALKVLIDTSFILPALGVEVEKEVMDTIPHFRRFEVYYSELSILEAMWKILKVTRPENLSKVMMGIESVHASYKHLPIPSDAFIRAVELYKKGHSDYIDNLLYSTAQANNLKFLTIDQSYIEFLERNSENGHIITPKEITRVI
ncbi:hypothetical protein B9Q06_12410 [Candidatus Marsarchaeota G2 archaeon ECH_B_2]|uniref:PIN domain-containing protein n=2 Tax=Candidatus Marsarchaeota group 2 TaxID=2203771 RepID=A0A2R6B3R7_9ARCH|nr:MAG: hypothetical protein B9Q06_12410 [Candidatus Marsarchaeota G2 archaeon ECH_B_2]PSN98956.1 MAG: hypothetical protein B9Q05_12280 [Candidatus Marsarchaeota G2 archaeon ECH_B_1]